MIEQLNQAKEKILQIHEILNGEDERAALDVGKELRRLYEDLTNILENIPAEDLGETSESLTSSILASYYSLSFSRNEVKIKPGFWDHVSQLLPEQRT